MKPTWVLATAERVLTQIRHDHRTLALLLLVPALLIGLVSWIFTDTPVFASIGPAMIALFPFIVMFLVTSIATLRERRSGTLERLLSLPLGKAEFILGYALAFGLLAVVQTGIAVGFAVWVCGLEVSGNLGLLFAVAVADALLGTSLGLLASAFARTEFQVVQFMPALIFPQILLGGIFLPRDQLPAALEAIGDWLPLSHAIDALTAVARGDQDAAYIWLRLGFIAIWIVVAIALGSVTLRRRTN
ncbi:ABC transporter permease [Paeniglutamicibacter sp. NPDC012692]|uniref:ABC transporter permease n=1 Tax=Paeniglutamicibacter sp. NPDC012692 TaxID=3364388 RepID=UPI0036B74649